MSKKCKLFFSVIGICFSVNVTSIHALPSPQEILREVDQIRAPGPNFRFSLAVSPKNDPDDEIKFDVRVKEYKKSLVLYQSPLNVKGRVMLMVGENMWIYIPGARTPIRISPQQQLIGKVSNADVARVAFSLDYSPKNAVLEQLDGSSVIKLELVAYSRGAAYGTILVWVNPNGYLPIKAEFYALSGRKIKTAYYKDYQPILGRLRPVRLEIVDEIRPSDVSILKYSSFSIDSTRDAFFQVSSMEKTSRM